MKKLNILFSILASATLAPITTLVSCSKYHFEINIWNAQKEWIESEAMDLEDGQTWSYTIDMTKWLAGEGTQHPERYPYFDLKLDNNITPLLKIKEGSLEMSIDGQKLSSQDWFYDDEIGGYHFSKENILTKIMNSRTIKGKFVLESISGQQIGTSASVVWYSPYQNPYLE